MIYEQLAFCFTSIFKESDPNLTQKLVYFEQNLLEKQNNTFDF